jgi:hypothetical protein
MKKYAPGSLLDDVNSLNALQLQEHFDVFRIKWQIMVQYYNASLLAQKRFQKSGEYTPNISFNCQGKNSQEYFI